MRFIERSWARASDTLRSHGLRGTRNVGRVLRRWRRRRCSTHAERTAANNHYDHNNYDNDDYDNDDYYVHDCAAA